MGFGKFLGIIFGIAVIFVLVCGIGYPFRLLLMMQMVAAMTAFLLFISLLLPNLDVRWPWRDRLEAWREDRQWEAFEASDEGKWWAAQRKALQDGEEIEPPWITFADNFDVIDLGPMWSGWRQGRGEGWIKTIWYPFWCALEADLRRDYLDKWDAPELWRTYLEPGRDEATATEADKNSIAGCVLNLWLKETRQDADSSASPQPGTEVG
jgi:hypothetical protein